MTSSSHQQLVLGRPTTPSGRWRIKGRRRQSRLTLWPNIWHPPSQTVAVPHWFLKSCLGPKFSWPPNCGLAPKFSRTLDTLHVVNWFSEKLINLICHQMSDFRVASLYTWRLGFGIRSWVCDGEIQEAAGVRGRNVLRLFDLSWTLSHLSSSSSHARR